MDIINFNYNAGSDRAIADPAPPNDFLKIYSISYPMLIKSVSKAGSESPTGGSTNLLIITRDDNTSPPSYDVRVEIPEGFPSTSVLLNQINQAIIDAFPTASSPLQIQAFGECQARWVNTDVVDWIVDYPNPETKQLVRGTSSSPLTETILINDSSEIFIPDSRLGAAQIELKLTNGKSVSIPSTGKWLDDVMYSFNIAPTLSFFANREVKMIAHFNSLRIMKELVCPRNDGIIISSN